MLARTIILALASAALASACSQGDSAPAAKARSVSAPAAPVAAAAPRSGEIDERLKERLARQEAAARMFEAKVLAPPAPKAAEPPAPARAAEPAAPSRPAIPPPVIAATTAPTTPPPAPAVIAAAAPPPAPKVEPAAVRPAPPAPTPEPAAAPRLLARVDPAFPREASQTGADSGLVKARMTLDAAGGVTQVDIIEANPRRVFDRAVVRALSQWRYSSGTDGRTVDMEVAFKR